MDEYWKQITPSDFAWKREALAFAKQALPGFELVTAPVSNLNRASE